MYIKNNISEALYDSINKHIDFYIKNMRRSLIFTVFRIYESMIQQATFHVYHQNTYLKPSSLVSASVSLQEGKIIYRHLLNCKLIHI